MSSLLFPAYVSLIHFDILLARGDFAKLLRAVHEYPRAVRISKNSVSDICSAIDMACIWYWKEVLCLQRSAATTCLLRSHGIAAEFVIGTQQLPFRAHAWVELDGRVINDNLHVRDLYEVLERC